MSKLKITYSFFVAIYNKMEDVNTLYHIKASNDRDAVVAALIKNCPEQYRDNDYEVWANSGKTFAEVCEKAVQSDLVISDIIQVTL